MKETPKELDILYERSSTRHFSDEPVPRSVIKRIVEAGTYAPTPCNQQLWNFILLDHKQTKRHLVDFASTSTAILGAPSVIVVLYDDWNRKEALQGASMAVQNILLAANAYGIGALTINSFGSPKVIRRILNIPSNQLICCFVLLGYPSKAHDVAPPVPRRAVDEVLHFNRFNRERAVSLASYNPENWSIHDLASYQKYYCRKTTLGKEMEISSSIERRFIEKSLSHLKGEGLDILSYDGSHLSLYPPRVKIDCLDLTRETSIYTKAAAKRAGVDTCRSFAVYSKDSENLGATQYSFISFVMKAERIPARFRRRILKQAFNSLLIDGELLIVSRTMNLPLRLFYRIVKSAFGDDTRKTGVHAYFGPYTPIDVDQIMKDVKDCGFEEIMGERFCFIPPISEEFLQLFLQYIRSGGTTFLHRQRRSNILTKALESILRFQGIRRSRFGSLTTIRARKTQPT